MSNRIIIGHPFGNANVREALVALANADSLEVFVTTICAEHLVFASLLPHTLRDEIRRRSFGALSSSQIVSHPLMEAFRLLALRLGRISPSLKRFSPNVDDVWRSLDSHLASEIRRRGKRALSVYAYEDGAFQTFSSFPDMHKIYELPIGYWKSMHALLNEERSLQPEWASTLTGLSDAPEKLARKDRELELADKVIVPSEFVRSTLPDRWAKKAVVVRYGCTLPLTKRSLPSPSKGPLKVLFCGSLGQRKGISYLFEAVKRMGHNIRLTVVGSEIAPCPSLHEGLKNATWHRSLPRPKVLELMRNHDIFLFPTLFEGRALVVLEALSEGLPVITTVNSGASELIINGRSGFLIPIRSLDAIQEALELLCANRELLAYMKQEAQVIASTSSWTSYRESLVQALSLDSLVS
jgi:alpha-maltose-1-phosphate synthase